MQLENLKPPASFLSEIKEDHRMIHAELDLPTSHEDNGYLSIVIMLNSIMEAYYHGASPEYLEFYGNVVTAFMDALRNAAEHGNGLKHYQLFLPGKKIRAGYWIGGEGVILGVRDEGDFFSKEEVKKKFEKRELFESTSKRPSEIIRGCGVKLCIYSADRIFVDIGQNALFMLFLLITD